MKQLTSGQFKYYGVLISVMVFIQTMCFILVKLHINIFGFTTTASGLLFIIDIYIIEVIGYCYSFELSRQATWINCFTHILFLVVSIIIKNLPIASSMHADYANAYRTLFALSSLIAIGSLFGNMVGDMISAVFVPKFKLIFNTKYTMPILFLVHIVSELVTILISYSIINLPDGYSFGYILKLVFGTMILKFSFSLLMIPFVNLLIKFILRNEGVSAFDYKQNYNLFKLAPDFSKIQTFDYIGNYGKKSNFNK